MKRNQCYIIILIVFIALSIAACNKRASMNTGEKQVSDFVEKDTLTESVIIEEEPLNAGKALNPLTGLWIDEEVSKRRPVAVMINNLKKALPQSGISQADIIYETLVEGEITRLMAIFQEFDAKKIGPVRSARHYYLDFTLDHDAIYVHYGRSPQAEKAFKELNMAHLEGLSYLDEIMCWRDPQRYNTPGMIEHSAYTNAERILKAWDIVGYAKERKEKITPLFNFLEEDTTLQRGEDATIVTLPFSKYQVSQFVYDENSKEYKRFQFDERHIDIENNEQLSTKNIIVQYTKIYPIPKDDAGRKEVELIGNGSGVFITNGKAIPISWSKTSHFSPTNFENKDGTALKINKGKTWICVFPEDKEVQLSN